MLFSVDFGIIGVDFERKGKAAMLITRETDYALRTIRALSGGERMTVAQICEKEHIPVPFTYKILKKLTGADIVAVTRGAGGGYRLSADLGSLTLWDVVQVTEEECVLMECMLPGHICEHNCEHLLCHLNKELERVQQVLTAELSRYSLAEILNRE